MSYYDVVCIGGGGAGVMAAVGAASGGARVALVSKEPVGYGNTRMAVGATACAGLPGDSSEEFISDILAAGEGINDPVLVETLVADAREALAVLEGFGHTFIRGQDGMLSIWAVGGHKKARTLQSSGGGPGLGQSLRGAVEKHGVDLLEDSLVLGLIRDGDRVSGVQLLDLADGKESVLWAGAVILCTGGGGWLFYPQTSNARTATGDGYALAFRAGAELVDMEQIQALPFGVTHPGAYRGTICGEPATAGPAGRIMNGCGETVLDGGINKMNRAQVVRHMAGHIRKGCVGEHGGLFLDLRPNLLREDGDKILDRQRSTGIFRVILPAYGRRAYDWEEPWEVLPTVHFFMGGVRVDIDGRSCVPGLFAAGEAQGGLHGGNRLGSVALTEIFVYGLRAGRAAAKFAARAGKAQMIQPAPVANGHFGRQGAHKPVTLVRRLQSLLWESMGLVREKEKLLQAMKDIEEIQKLSRNVRISAERIYNTEMQDYIELDFMLLTARLALTGALLREESRGAHLRFDYPDSGGEKWQKNIILRQGNDGNILHRTEECQG
jgi:succinate dehydrogenase/fumarate reductase flavoprotein subunit